MVNNKDVVSYAYFWIYIGRMGRYIFKPFLLKMSNVSNKLKTLLPDYYECQNQSQKRFSAGHIFSTSNQNTDIDFQKEKSH